MIADKKFRDFLNLGNGLDANLSDDVMDVLGFLAYEMVRSLCDAGKSTRASMLAARTNAERADKAQREREGAAKGGGSTMDSKGGKRKRSEGGADVDGEVRADDVGKKSKDGSGAETSPSKAQLVTPISLFSAPIETPPVSATNTGTDALNGNGNGKDGEGEAVVEQPLTLDEVNAGYVALQQREVTLKASGMRNWRAGRPLRK